jgi:hypothetical protein
MLLLPILHLLSEKMITSHIRPLLTIFEVITLLTDFQCVMVLALSALGITAHFAFSVYIPISTISAQLTLTETGTLAGNLVNPPTSFEPCFLGVLINTPSAILAVDVVFRIGLF